MKERELEKIMYGFINGEIDVLVSTTIIETGLDISNVNTMIIHDSDQMGLSQLYQLRGDVYKRQAGKTKCRDRIYFAEEQYNNQDGRDHGEATFMIGWNCTTAESPPLI